MRKIIGAASAAIIAVALGASVVLAHDVQSISGTVDCQGNYSITVHGDVYGGVHLIVKLNGVTIYDQAQNGSTDARDFGPFTGNGGFSGEAIFAKSGDESDANGASGTLTQTEESCQTASPSPSHSPKPSQSPVVTQRPSPSQKPSKQPVATATPQDISPEPSLPNTATK